MPDSRQIHPFLDGNGRIGGLLITFRMREEHRARITEHLGRAAANGQRVMDRLFDHPIVTVARVREWLGITPAGVKQIVARLEGIGLLREATGYARNRRFRFESYLRLFEEPEEARS